jgi:hypothetical protein
MDFGAVFTLDVRYVYCVSCSTAYVQYLIFCHLNNLHINSRFCKRDCFSIILKRSMTLWLDVSKWNKKES